MLELKRAVIDLIRLRSKISQVYSQRMTLAWAGYLGSGQEAWFLVAGSGSTCRLEEFVRYQRDLGQRSILFWDAIRRRGNNYLAHERAGKPPLLAYDYEVVVDGRELQRPVNYALVRIIPPLGVTVDDHKRPFVIVDPRAGHGPGIGGFKKDSQVGVALRAGHPVYFVVFFELPEPGQTVTDVCEAEGSFVQAVANRHADSPKPALVGNCQGGWATMLLAASRPDITGPIVINGAPMSYWSGNWQDEDGGNPMRYLGGLMGGSWSAMLASDLGDGVVDGAHFVANFERLNPANTFWGKYYQLFSNIDQETERFLDFERWWGGFFLMNEAELRWIVDNLFVGNLLARGEAASSSDRFFDLKAIRSPMVIFSSAGDNITPPQQALNWIADAYSSTEEIKACGQVIVGLFHPDVGHLGLFVSGHVSKKEHAQIVEVLEYIESLRPGLYLMDIHQAKCPTAEDEWDVTIEEHDLEDLRVINRLERQDEKPFEVVAQTSAWNEKLYLLFGRPLLQSLVTPGIAELGRFLHPLRLQRWALSDGNPCLWPLPVLASAVKRTRRPEPSTNQFRHMEHAASDVITAGLDFYRDFRDATMEACFYAIYGPPAVLDAAADVAVGGLMEAPNPRNLPLVRDALTEIGKGGYPEAIALIAALVGRESKRIPLERLGLVNRVVRKDEVLSRLSPREVRRIKAEQAVVAVLEPERGLLSLPMLLADAGDRRRALELLDQVDDSEQLTAEQKGMIERISTLLQEWSPPQAAPQAGEAGAGRPDDA